MTIAARGRAIKEYMRYYSSPNTFSNALSPASAAIVGKAFDIVCSPEGAELRDKLMRNIRMLRGMLGSCDLETYGDPSAIVCVKMGSEALTLLLHSAAGPVKSEASAEDAVPSAPVSEMEGKNSARATPMLAL